MTSLAILIEYQTDRLTDIESYHILSQRSVARAVIKSNDSFFSKSADGKIQKKWHHVQRPSFAYR